MRCPSSLTWLLLLGLGAVVSAAPLEVGRGVNTASVSIRFSDGFQVDFRVHFGEDPNATTTGLGLLDVIEAESDLTTVREDFGWGEFVDGIACSGHADVGYGGGAAWWHYWENDAGSRKPWVASATGAGGRTVSHGDTDAWIYGTDAAPASIDLVDVGQGVNHARVFIEFSDGFTAEFRVHFGRRETDTVTGLDLLDVVESETELTTVRQDFGWGEFVDGIAFQRHGDAGFGGGEAWWHYWEDEAGSRADWSVSATGAGSRIVSHGDADAWIYGHAERPAPATVSPFWDGYGQYVEDSNDFATAVVAYTPTQPDRHYIEQQPYDDAEAALGRPTAQTVGDGWLAPPDVALPIVPVYGPWGLHEVVSLGDGGALTLAFNHPVRDDAHNPYGLDLIVYGNALQWIDGTRAWENGDPRLVTVGPEGGAEPGVVSVSQDGLTWYSFTSDPDFQAADANFIKLPPEAPDGPWADGFAPTLGHVYNPDPCALDPGLGSANRWWAEPTNPTLPLDPGLDFASLAGMSVARVAETYGDAAGGVGYDLARLDLPVDPETGLKWFRYLRIDDLAGDGLSCDIDAAADVSCPGDYRHPAPEGDVNGDYCVDTADVAVVETLLGQAVAAGDPVDLNADGVIDQADLDRVKAQLGACGWPQPGQ